MDEQQLFDRFHAAFNVEPRPGMPDRIRTALVGGHYQPPARAWFDVALPRASTRLVAAILAVLVAVAAIGGFLAVYQFEHRPIPARTSFISSCRQGLDMVTSSTGWNGATSRTTDGGVTWKDVSPPNLPNAAKGRWAECTFDANHAWIAEPTGASPIHADHVVVFSTRNGGETWQQGTPIAVPPVTIGSVLQLAFTDFRHGWLFTDTGNRALFATSDGGLDWTPIAQTKASVLPTVAVGCTATGATFVSVDRGWIAWDCSQVFGSSSPSPAGPVVAATIDGGHTWSALRLPSMPAVGTCGGASPVFTGDHGILAVSCQTGGPGWSAVYRTADAGDTWSIGRLPVWADLTRIALADGTTTFALPTSAVGSDLYETGDAGEHWTLVEKSLFVGQNVDAYQFMDSKTGFALTTTSPETPWGSTDGGRTWSLPTGFRTVPGNVACPATTSSGSVPEPVNLFSATTGWAVGGLRTTDGGAHWANVDPQSVPNRSAGSAEFYLDASHAWIAETAGSSANCSDHVVVFSTSDGGVTWQQGTAIQVPARKPSDLIWGQTDSAASPTTQSIANVSWLDFVDAKDGWLLVASGTDWFDAAIAIGPLYRTTDGGLNWTAISASRPGLNLNCTSGLPYFSFSSATTGWLQGPACPGDAVSLQVTHDGGVTWKLQTIGPACGCSAAQPIFFDAGHGLTTFSDQSGSTFILATRDGGATWASHKISDPGLNPSIDFIGPNEGWLTGTGDNGANFLLKRTSDGGKTWTLVNAHLPVGPDQGNYAVFFADSRTGLLWMSTAIYKTTDGGRSWVQIQLVVQ
jgi:photosystem II stability/assembly factor-like uncharacterized protein